jgi:hypothetical protein
MKHFIFPLTDRQRKLVESKARALFIGAGSKTGKSMALYCWLIDGLLQGEPCCFIGPFFFRSRTAFNEIKNLLRPWIANRQVKINEQRCVITCINGGVFDFLSGDNYQTLFGANYKRIVLDESSRMPSGAYTAALTTIASTNGQIRCAFNLDLGVRNWSVKHLLRIQGLSPEQRAETGEDYATFPTGGDGLVSDETIQQFKAQMPLVLWEALFLAKIPTEDSSLFRNLDKIFSGHEQEKPTPGKRYFMGIDLGRRRDFTCLTVISEDGDVVWCERFTAVDWNVQTGRAALLYRTYDCRLAVVDSTGVGDPIAQALEELQLNVKRYAFTAPSRKALVEEAVIACDGKEFRVPNTEKFQVYRMELESFEYQLDGGSIKYAVPQNSHDDAAISLFLAIHAFRLERGAVWGYVLYLQQKAKDMLSGTRDMFGELVHRPKSKPAAPVMAKKPIEIRTEQPKPEAKQPCPACQSKSTIPMSSGAGKLILHCNQCKADSLDGVVLQTAPSPDRCTNYDDGEHRMTQMAGGRPRCCCGYQPDMRPVQSFNGATFGELNARRSAPFHGFFDRPTRRY